ncbi:hypothetical protein [Phycicoccus sp. DTK01]|uniref:hypothetical protein n=1 Tax=Phycicoccus sp. DTK01 TaxID=2785745 RepID=UPI001A8F7763|nr:hypothetical protein [Phycicoccus sp. DTK01]GIL35500.1 hypothetical protein PDTK01_15750 [Phycicoccus sp. DTK01]
MTEPATHDPTPAAGSPTAVADPAGLVTGRRTTRLDVGVGVLVGLVVAAVVLVWRSPLVPTDPWHYVMATLDFPSDQWIALGLTRYGIMLATIPPALLWKNAEATYYVWPLLSCAVLAASVYLLGRRFWGVLAGLVAVVVLFANTVLFYNASRFYPDVMAMALVVLALLTAVLARDRGLRGRGAVLWVLATGFLLGWSFEVRETAFFSWPVVLAVLTRRGSALRTWALVALPVLAWAAVDVAISTLAYGTPLAKVQALLGMNPEGVGYPPPTSGGPPADLSERTRGYYLLAVPLRALETRPDGLWMVATGVLAILALVAGNRALRLMAFGFVSVYALNLLAGGVAVPTRPLGSIDNPRYWIQYFPPIALVVGGVTALLAARLARALPRGRRLLRAAAVGGVAVLVCAVPAHHAQRFMTTTSAFAPNGGDAMERLRSALEGRDFRVPAVWTDSRTMRVLPAYQRPVFNGPQVWSGPGERLRPDSQPRPGDAVLYYSAYDDGVCVHCYESIRPWMEAHPTPPASWELVYATPDRVVELYLVR